MRLSHQAIVVAFCAACLCSASAEDESPQPDLAPVYAKLKPLVTKHYQKAKVTLKDNKIHFEFNTRKYMIHGRNLLGGYTDAREQIGPQSPSRDRQLPKQGGVVGDIRILKGQYGGQAGMPQVLHCHYFDRLIMAPYSPKLDHHLDVNLLFAKDIPPEFKEHFMLLMNQYDKHVAISPHVPAASK